MVSGYHSVPGCFIPPKSWWVKNRICHVVLRVKYFDNIQPDGKEIKQHSCKGKLNKTIRLQKLPVLKYSIVLCPFLTLLSSGIRDFDSPGSLNEDYG